MQIREIPPITLLCCRMKVNLAGMLSHVRVRSRELYAEAHTQDMEITGPLYWIYHGADGNPETIFQLYIGIPVTPTDQELKSFSILRIETFRCASFIHFGPWEQLPSVYGRILQQIQSEGYQLTGENREVYLNMDFTDEGNHITEIQIGIK
jgi:effector-binding domain-containing protein